jgi:cobalt-zinc-cadmium efflux system outer membrane protein
MRAWLGKKAAGCGVSAATGMPRKRCANKEVLVKTFWLSCGICLALTGCQATKPHRVTTAHRLSGPPQEERTLPVTEAKPASEGTATVRPVQHTEAVAPEPETLPPAALRPVVVGALTLADLEQMALSANPSVARAGSLVEAARGNWVQVGLPPNPSVGYEGQQLGSRGLAEQHGVFVGQEFVRGRKLGLNREVAAQEVARAEHQLAAQQQRVLTDVRIAFYQVLIAERQEKLTGDLHGIAAEGVKTAETLLMGKEVGKVDLVQAQLELENADILVQNARNRTRAAWQTLASVVGNLDLPPQPLEGDVEEEATTYDFQASLDRLLESSPEIAAAAADVERARWAAERARVEPTPNITVQGLINWRDNGIGGRSDAGITVGVPLPIWNRNQGGIVQAAQQAVAAERALQQLELSLQNRLAPVYERYASALNQVTKYRSRILPAAQESLMLMRQRYKAGETDYVNLLTAQRTYSQTNLNYLESLRELKSAEAQIEGLLLSGSLESR